MSVLNGSIDFTDKRILSALLSKGRSTFAELASQVGLTAPTVHDRVKRLERSGVIEGYTAIVNPASLGFDISAMVSITTSTLVSARDFETSLMDIPEIQTCYSVAGEESYVAIVLTRTPQTLETLLQRIKAIPGTVATKASVILSAPISQHSLPLEDKEDEFPSDGQTR